MIRQLVLLLALVAAFLTPPELALGAGQSEIKEVHADVSSHATEAEEASGAVDLSFHADGGEPPRRGYAPVEAQLARREGLDEAWVAPRRPWDHRGDIRRFRRSLYLGRSEPNRHASSSS